jgi:hypothetical protein
MAPEALTGGRITSKVDIYSFGMLVWELLSRIEVFKHMSDYRTFVRAIIGGERPPIDSTWPEQIKQLLMSCWELNPLKRPTADEALGLLNQAINDIAGNACNNTNNANNAIANNMPNQAVASSVCSSSSACCPSAVSTSSVPRAASACVAPTCCSMDVAQACTNNSAAASAENIIQVPSAVINRPASPMAIVQPSGSPCFNVPARTASPNVVNHYNNTNIGSSNNNNTTTANLTIVQPTAMIASPFPQSASASNICSILENACLPLSQQQQLQQQQQQQLLQVQCSKLKQAANHHNQQQYKNRVNYRESVSPNRDMY